MLLELHVRNLALIERADMEFGDGLEILTGETGAGKSIIIGSVWRLDKRLRGRLSGAEQSMPMWSWFSL